MGRHHSSSRSRSRSRDRRSRSRSRHGSRSRSRSMSPEGFRVHVADLGIDCTKRDLEKRFEKFGPFYEIWLARNPPCFAFIVFKYREDADEAIKQMDGEIILKTRVRVSYARPRNKGSMGMSRARRGYDPNLRCYQCGERGHFSRDCADFHKRFRSHRSRTRSRSRSPRRRSRDDEKRSRSRSRSRSPSPTKEKKKSRKDSKSPKKKSKKSKSKSRSRSRSESPAKNGSPPKSSKSKWENRQVESGESD